MKSIALAFVALLVGVCAVPSDVKVVEPKNERFVDDLIVSIIEALIDAIKDRGLDPYVLVRIEGEYKFPVAGIFSASGYVEDFSFTGLSNIVINEVSFDGTEVYVDLSLPGVEAVVGDAAGQAQILKRNLEAGISGRLAIRELRLAARANLALSGYFVEDIRLSSSLGGIESDLNINILGRDVSGRVNEFLSEILPETLEEYSEQLNRLVARLIVRIIERIF